MSWCEPISCLAFDPAGRSILSVLTKRTYAIDRSGHTVPAEEPLPLDTSAEPPAPGYDPSWKAELDVAPFKVATDVVVFGAAYAPGGRCRQMRVAVSLPHLDRTAWLQVTGDRRCSARGSGPPAVSAPEPFEKMPLGYDRAYGGVDPGVEHPAPPRDMDEALSQLVTEPGAYPRNPVGRGYVVHGRPELLEGLPLPNIERVDQPLVPERIVTGDPRLWHGQPLPGGFGWVDPGWFPRCVFASAHPPFPAVPEIPEVALGHLPADFLARFRMTAEGPRLDHRLFTGASLGLSVPYLHGAETIVTRGLAPEGELAVRLPGDRPRIVVRLQGREMAGELVPHTVALMMEERLVSLVWRASVPLPEGYEPPMATMARPEVTGLEDFEVVIS